jgi:CrcB protein
VCAVSLGGAAGSLGRWALAAAVPAGRAGFPWATFATNASGCLLIGVLMVLVTEVWAGRRLLRPFLGIGVLGGYTTFSTYAVDVTRLVSARAAGTALAYLAATALAAFGSVYLGTVGARLLVRRGHRSGES